MISVLITGGNGQLATCLKDFETQYKNLKFIFKNSSTLDVSDLVQVEAFFEKNKVDWIINCAAYTAVDKAENEVVKATNVNLFGAKNLAIASEKHQVKLIHVSTDFVFDGKSSSAYKESDATNPQGVYGKTKLDGELAIMENLKAYFILRTSWLYSEHGNNFMKTMLRLAEERDELGIVCDQIGSPTYAKDLANCILQIISMDSNHFGIYHYSNEGVASWYDFAKSIFEYKNVDIKVNPISTKAFPTPAKRPPMSVLNSAKIKETFKIEIPYWRESLKSAISNL